MTLSGLGKTGIIMVIMDYTCMHGFYPLVPAFISVVHEQSYIPTYPILFKMVHKK